MHAIIVEYSAKHRCMANYQIAAVAKAIDDSFEKVTGPAFKMDIGLGVTEATMMPKYIYDAAMWLSDNDADD